MRRSRLENKSINDDDLRLKSRSQSLSNKDSENKCLESNEETLDSKKLIKTVDSNASLAGPNDNDVIDKKVTEKPKK
jgi:hypothetical protein